MNDDRDPSAENRPAWYWRGYDSLERVVAGGALGWVLTIPLLALTGLITPEAGLNGYAGDYAWYATIPLGMIIWHRSRRGRPGGWVSRALFGGALGLFLGFIFIVLSGALGEAIYGAFFFGIPLGMIAWPIIMRFAHPRLPPPEGKERS